MNLGGMEKEMNEEMSDEGNGGRGERAVGGGGR